MKHLLLFFLFSGSLDGFSQVADTTRTFRDNYDGTWTYGPPVILVQAPDGTVSIKRTPAKPDTLRATLIIYYDHGPAILHTKPGFVVRGEREVYLDDKKRVIKAPWIVYDYRRK